MLLTAAKALRDDAAVAANCRALAHEMAALGGTEAAADAVEGLIRSS
jgi:UDP:flavonoid glycosyltransferase YjiC (YdhE family)